jgi:hypothetical protein
MTFPDAESRRRMLKRGYVQRYETGDTRAKRYAKILTPTGTKETGRATI